MTPCSSSSSVREHDERELLRPGGRARSSVTGSPLPREELTELIELGGLERDGITGFDVHRQSIVAETHPSRESRGCVCAHARDVRPSVTLCARSRAHVQYVDTASGANRPRTDALSFRFDAGDVRVETARTSSGVGISHDGSGCVSRRRARRDRPRAAAAADQACNVCTSTRDRETARPLVIGGHDVPRRPPGRRRGDRRVVAAPCTRPSVAGLEVVAAELPALLRVLEPGLPGACCCSSFDRCRKTFTRVVPSSASIRSNSRTCAAPALSLFVVDQRRARPRSRCPRSATG